MSLLYEDDKYKICVVLRDSDYMNIMSSENTTQILRVKSENGKLYVESIIEREEDKNIKLQKE